MSIALAKTFTEVEAELAELEGSTEEFAPHRRIVLHNALADMLYAVSGHLRDQGKNAEANECHDLANEHWSNVCAEVAELDKSKT